MCTQMPTPGGVSAHSGVRSTGFRFLALGDERTFLELLNDRFLSGLPDVTKGMVQAGPSPLDAVGPF